MMVPRTSLGFVWCLVVCVVWLSGAERHVAAAQDAAASGPGSRAEGPRASAEADASARRAFEAGREAYDRGSFATALVHFEQAYALRPSPELLYNVGRAADSDGQPTRAITAYSSYLQAYPGASNREFVRARLDKMRALEQAHSSLRSRAEDPAASTLARKDGAAGATASAARSPEPAALPTVAHSAPSEQGPTLAGGAAGLPLHDGPEPTRPVWKRAWFWTAVGAVVAGGVIAGVLAARPESPARATADDYVVIPEAH